MKSKEVLLKSIRKNKNNPRIIRDAKFQKLVKSLKELPNMLRYRPIVVDNDNVIVGGNMRYSALLELGYEKVPSEWIVRADDLTEEQLKQFVIKDNVSFGDWDWDALANDWDNKDLNDWGMDVWVDDGIEYEPNVTPETEHKNVEQDSINKAEENKSFQQTKTELINVNCPHCLESFAITKEYEG